MRLFADDTIAFMAVLKTTIDAKHLQQDLAKLAISEGSG
jgi:hypothetical protein